MSELRGEHEAQAIYDEMLGRLGSSSKPELREQVAIVLFNKAYGLRALGRREEALVVFDALGQRFGNAPELELRRRVAQSFVHKANTLYELGRVASALSRKRRPLCGTWGADDDRPAFVEQDAPTIDVLVARARSRRDYLTRDWRPVADRNDRKRSGRHALTQC